MKRIFSGTNRNGYEIYFMKENEKDVYYISRMNSKDVVSVEKVNFDINPRGGLSIIRLGVTVPAQSIFMTEKNRVFDFLNDDDFIPVFAKDSEDIDFVYIPEKIDKIYTNKYLNKKEKYILWDQVVVKVQRVNKDAITALPNSEFRKDGYVLYEVIK